MEETRLEPAEGATHIEVNVARDALRATIDVSGTTRGHTTDSLVSAVRSALVEAGVVKGVDDAALRQAAETFLKRGEPVQGIVVALGRPPVEAVSARVTFQFELGGRSPAIVAQERATGSVDEATLAKPCVRAGDVLAVVMPAQPGEDGYTVLGVPIMARPPGSAAVKAGAGVQLLDDGLTYVVAADTIGYVDFAGGTLEIEPPVVVSDDAMEARFVVYPGAMFTPGDIEHWLETHGVVHGIDHEAIAGALARASERNEPLRDTVIARCTPPTPGEDARIEFHFRREPLAGWVGEDDTQIDYHERGFLQRVQKGDLLARKITATPGVAGRDISGKEIAPVPGSDVTLGVAGEVALSQDGLECHAMSDGVVAAADAGTIGVFQEFTVPGDVDYHTGNLDMKGVLVVRGWVRSGFKVHATGDVLIGGGVEASIVESDANLAVKCGVLGGNEGRIASKGDLAADFIENAQVQAGGNVNVRNGILNSQVTAEGGVSATEGKGHIIGGAIRAARGVEVNELGSRAAVRTVVDVGLDTASRAKLAEMERDCALFERNQQKIGKALASFARRSTSRKPAPEEMQALAKLAHFRRDVELKRRDIASFWKRVEGAAATIKVRKAVYEGVIIMVMGRRLDVQEDILSPGEFAFDAGEGRVAYRG